MNPFSPEGFREDTLAPPASLHPFAGEESGRAPVLPANRRPVPDAKAEGGRGSFTRFGNGRVAAALGMAVLVLLLYPDLVQSQGSPAPVVPPGASGSAGQGDWLGQIPPDAQYWFTTIGLGGLAGWSVGYTLKKVAKLAALVIGIIFLGVQFLASQNYIIVDWDRIQQAVPDSAFQQAYMALMSMLTYQFPFAGSFAVGFWLGFRRG
jgi:uncharacterized membrane protein (Fun14 family)